MKPAFNAAFSTQHWQIREFLVADDCFYIVMELIQGRPGSG